MSSVLENQKRDLRRISRKQIFNFCIYFLSQIAVFAVCLYACWLACVRPYNSEFFYDFFGNGFFAAAIFLVTLVFLITSTFSIAATLVTRKWIKKFEFLNRRVVWELDELQFQFLEMEKYTDSPQKVLFFDWNSSELFFAA